MNPRLPAASFTSLQSESWLYVINSLPKGSDPILLYSAPDDFEERRFVIFEIV